MVLVKILSQLSMRNLGISYPQAILSGRGKMSIFPSLFMKIITRTFLFDVCCVLDENMT